jgi:phosphoribosylformylglycinamidine cyclo-ligase
MNRTFNNGIGMVVVVDAANAKATAETLRQGGETVYEIGVIADRGTGPAVAVA